MLGNILHSLTLITIDKLWFDNELICQAWEYIFNTLNITL
jgi:hypothetical protein